MSFKSRAIVSERDVRSWTGGLVSIARIAERGNDSGQNMVDEVGYLRNTLCQKTARKDRPPTKTLHHVLRQKRLAGVVGTEQGQEKAVLQEERDVASEDSYRGGGC